MSKSAGAIRLSRDQAVQSTITRDPTMKYLCLLYENEAVWPTLPQAEAEALMGEYFAFTDNYTNSGHVLGGEALQPTNTATTIRVRNGKMSTTDGPFAETREQLGGYYLLEAKDLNEAIQIAAKIPAARTGGVEVRPIMEFSRD
jgi:hypothetical protein